MRRAVRSEAVVITAAEVSGVASAYADRVHDEVCRHGCPPEQAGVVVESSALDLVSAAARDPDRLGDLTGWWFAHARELAASCAPNPGNTEAGDTDAADAEVGNTEVGNTEVGNTEVDTEAADAATNGSGQHDGIDDRGGAKRAREQHKLSAALRRMPEQERTAVLLRDSYDLPPPSVAAALGCDAERVSGIVARGRLALLTSYQNTPVSAAAGHVTDLATLGLLAEDSREGARELGGRAASARRHAQACPSCQDVLGAQERARELLLALSVRKMPDDERERLLSRVSERAAQALPATAARAVVPVAVSEAAQPARGPVLPMWLIAWSLVIAAALGVAVGFVLPGSSGT